MSTCSREGTEGILTFNVLVHRGGDLGLPLLRWIASAPVLGSIGKYLIGYHDVMFPGYHRLRLMVRHQNEGH